MTEKLQTIREAEAEAKANGAKAGAKARRREANESAAQTAAVLAAESGDREKARWTHSYRAGTDAEGDPDRRTLTVREDARDHLTPRELLAATYHAAKLAAGQLEGRHGVPPFSPDEVAEVRDELVCRLLTDANPQGGRGNLPRRERITRAYLVQRAKGIVLDDPNRANLDKGTAGIGEGEDELDPADIAAGSESQAASRKAAHDPMLNESAEGTWPEIAAAGEIIQAPARARRAAAYLTGGGRAESWARHWKISLKNARHKAIPDGAHWLRDREHGGKNGRRFSAAVRMASLLDRDALDAWEIRRAAIESGLSESPARARALIEMRDRTRPDANAPVTVRRAAPDLDAAKLAESAECRVIVKSRRRSQKPAQSKRTHAKRSAAAGWTTPRT